MTITIQNEADLRLLSAAADMYAVLKAIEWTADRSETCPCCFGYEPQGGDRERHHNATCALAKAIAKAEGR